MKRLTFDSDASGAQAPAPQRPLSICAAYGCRLAGSMSAHSDSKDWWCAHHFFAEPDDLQRVTAALNQHAALIDVLNDGQTLLNRRPTEVQEHVHYWQVKSDAIARMGYVVGPAKFCRADDLGEWLYRVRTLLGTLVQKQVNVKAKANREGALV